MIPSLTHLKEGWRILALSRHRRKTGFTPYLGDAKAICAAIVLHRWNPERCYYRTGAYNFAQFWSRDFGMCAEALIALGHADKVILTLDYALERFVRAGKITTTITPDGKAYDFPKIASDSLPFIAHALRAAKADDLVQKYLPFLTVEARRYARIVFDMNTGMVKKNASFSSIKDYAKRSSSTYDNSMAFMLSEDLDALEIPNPLAGQDIAGAMERELWNGKYFFDDMHHYGVVTGDANVFPFWVRAFKGKKGKKMFTSALKAIRRAGLDRPFPLKYSSQRNNAHSFILPELLIKDYESHSIWMHLGLCFLDVMRQQDPKQFAHYYGQYTRLIEKHRTFLEVFDSDGSPFKRTLYICDEGMLWAAKYLALNKKDRSDK